MGTREERTLELNVISATDLKKVKAFGKQNSYVVAYINRNNKKKTRVDEDGDLNPTWNSKLTLTADEQLIQQGGAYITLEIHCHGAFGEKLVGTSTVPLSDIAREVSAKLGKDQWEGFSSSAPQFMAFEVHRPSGKVKGVLNVSISLGEKRTIQVYQNQPPPQMYTGRASGASYPAGVPYPPQQYSPQYATPYPQQGYACQQGYPPQQAYYPQQAPYYPQQGFPQQGYYQQQPQRRPGGLGALGGAGLGLGAGLLGGLLVADVVENIADDNHNDYNNDYNNDYGGGDDFGGGDFGGDSGGF